jgi:hypothetical protein
MATAINLGVFNIESVERIRFRIKKDGANWDLSSGSVSLKFEKPNRSTQFDRDMVAEDAAEGLFYYDTTITDVDTAGFWHLGVTVTDGATVKKYPYEITFKANDNP